MLLIDLTAQFAPIFEGMVLVLIVAAAGLVFDALRGAMSKPPEASPRGAWSADAKPLRP